MGKSISGRGKSKCKCKCPEVEVYILCSKNSKEACVTGAEWESGRAAVVTGGIEVAH